MSLRLHHDPLTGAPLGLYDPAVHGEATPAPWIAVTEAQAAALSEGAGRWAVRDGALAARAPEPAAYAAEALRRVAAQIERMAAPFVADVPWVETLGWEIKRQAAARIEAEAASASDHLMIGAEAAVTGEPPETLVALILARAEAHHAALGLMSGVRRAAAARIAAAMAAPDPVAEIDAAVAEAAAQATAFLSSLEP